MSLRRFPGRSPKARATTKTPGRALTRPSARRPPGQFHWPPTREEIDAVEVIDLGSQEPISSAGFVAVLKDALEQPSQPRPTLYLRTPPPRVRAPKPKRLRLWPIAIGLVALELVESRAFPPPDSLPPPQPPAVTAAAHASAPPAEPPAAAPAEPVASPVAPVASPRGLADAPRTPRRQRRAERAEPAPHTDAVDDTAAAAIEPDDDDRSVDHLDPVDDSFTPPRAAVRQRLAPRPAPFPAARGSRTWIEVMVDARGRVESARLRSPATSYFDARALEAVRAWQFEPARRGGRPVRASVDVEVESH